MILNFLVFAGILTIVFVLYMLFQPDKGKRVRLFNESKRNIANEENQSAIKNYFYTANEDLITFQTADGASDHGKCLFIKGKLIAIKCDCGKVINKSALTLTQIENIESIKGGFRK